MTIDANIIIAYLDGERNVVNALSRWRSEGKTLFLPTIVEAEVLSFSGWTANERKIVELFLEENFTSVSFDRIASRFAAEIRCAVKIKLPDAAIAATALYMRTPLVTRNQKDFKNIPTLSIIAL
ncbi:MAG TPA: type II toxin-antitoxin system VapC family toxin [Patescibacteria group bacterium]|nr:type II toxin-antitoxin system VapC family toxin [Patescibacteria group bacterium]